MGSRALQVGFDTFFNAPLRYSLKNTQSDGPPIAIGI